MEILPSRTMTDHQIWETEEEATASTRALARRLRIRAVDREKTELLGAIQRLPADSEEGRAVRIALRDLDATRRALSEAS